MGRIVIEEATTNCLKEKVYHLRYKVYVEEMRRTQVHADHKSKVIREPLDDKGIVYLALMGNEPVGTIRLNYHRNGDLVCYPEYYRFELFAPEVQSTFAVTTKLIVLPELRRTSLAVRLAQVGFERCLRDGILYNFIDCNPHLEEFFQKLGFVRYTGRIYHPEYGDVMPLVLPMTDLDHLKRANSPFAKSLERRLEANALTQKQLKENQYVCCN